MVKCEQDELHQNVTIPQDLAHRERDRLMQLQEGEPQVMINLSRFYLRQGNLDKAEHYMRDAYSYDIKNN